MHIQRHTHTSTHVQSAHKRNGDNQAQEPGWERRKKGFLRDLAHTHTKEDAKGDPAALEFALKTAKVAQGTLVSIRPSDTDVYVRTPSSRPLGNILIYIYISQKQKPIYTNLKEKIRAHRASSKATRLLLTKIKATSNQIGRNGHNIRSLFDVGLGCAVDRILNAARKTSASTLITTRLSQWCISLLEVR